MGIIPQGHALVAQQLGLLGPAGSQPPRVVDHPVAGIIPIQAGVAQHAAHQAGVFLPPDQAGKLPVGGHAAGRDLAHRSQDFIDQPLVRHAFYLGSSCVR